MKVPFLDVKAGYLELRAGLDEACRRVLESGSYILGGEVAAFEREFAAYCGARHCVGVGNGLEAIALILEALGVGPGDEVIVPSNTYIATWLAASRVGAMVVPVEPDPATFNIDPKRIPAALTSRTRAVIAVHLYGQAADVEGIRAALAGRPIPIVEDACQGHGAGFKGRRAGALGRAAAFSFYPTKNLGAFGDGGAVTTDDAVLAERVRLLRNYGSAKKYHNETRGHNSRLDELHAAMLRVKLGKLDEWNQRRRMLAGRYLRALEGVPGLVLPAESAGCEHVWHLFVVRHPRRDALQARLAEAGVGTLIHYPIPPHLSGAYAGSGWKREDFPVAAQLAETVLSLPFGPHLDAASADYAAGQIRKS
ncbi:MAG: DegT/DnrJ/EryC1/StrS family aminotransferase [Elusimicrobia bacterium]|nr:DegT/DnrJ/EryC1/StrS family aminotransferase [Elusimicrobiota bacterium]